MKNSEQVWHAPYCGGASAEDFEMQGFGRSFHAVHKVVSILQAYGPQSFLLPVQEETKIFRHRVAQFPIKFNIDDFLDEGSEVLKISTKFISRETFDKYGPGLLCMFEVFDDFCKADFLSYLDCPTGHFIGYHCMVVLGVRNEG